MRVLLAIAVVAAATFTVPAIAQQSANPQQQRMTACNTEAGAQQLSGDARKKFMSDCLAGKTTSGSGSSTPQQRMTTCNAEAGSQHLTGDARKSFMSDCLKKGP